VGRVPNKPRRKSRERWHPNKTRPLGRRRDRPQLETRVNAFEKGPTLNQGRNFHDIIDDAPPPELLQRIKEYNVKFIFPTPPKLAPPVLGLYEVDFGYPGQQELFKKLNFGVDMDSRVAIVGPNGVGKSTLLRLLYGKVQPVRLSKSSCLLTFHTVFVCR